MVRIRLKELRETQGWSQWETALKLHCHPRTIQLWESGVTMPSRKHLEAMALLFRVQVADLFAKTA